ncbi:2-oxoacid:acceptor oxidoreductase family protein [Sulfuriflexus mobilis]|uniref:2-oxoacid:acceptor oxidoreductase family protein n=1 Tax=Sulfuriflexus mobilis TaxID=1811807 RepID=UPI000F82FCDF|nr:2-oxoacid:acceptor oxidoreductase family protein [Sulfuriflexus mobilis]
MYRIRFHGRGGQGMKTASRILGTAFFLEGFEVQDAPRYGAERRGAPIFAYVRAARQPINERGIIQRPDLVIVADDSLVPVPAAGVLGGLTANTLLLINSHDPAETWTERLRCRSPIIILPITGEVEDRAEMPYIGATCAGAAARLVGVISREALAAAIREELVALGPDIIERNLDKALAAFDTMQAHAGAVSEAAEVLASSYTPPDWINLPFEDARRSAPVIHAGLTSVEVKTGLWRTLRPVIDYERCVHCWWVCSSFCPDGAIAVTDEKLPVIDYDHCKGCMICVAQCPPHAIEAVPEHEAQQQEASDKQGVGK